MKAFRAYTISLNGVVKYVGVTTRSISRRWTEHKSSNSPCTALLRAIKKHGPKAFEITHVASARTYDELNDLEVALVVQYDTIGPGGYNIRKPGIKYAVISDASRAKISEAGRLRLRGPMTDEQKKKISETLKGRKLDKEVYIKIAAKNRGKVRSAEAVARMKKAALARVWTPEELERTARNFRGRTHTLEARKMISDAKRGVKLPAFTEEHKKRIAVANSGKKHSAETRQKLSAIAKNRFRNDPLVAAWQQLFGF